MGKHKQTFVTFWPDVEQNEPTDCIIVGPFETEEAAERWAERMKQVRSWSHCEVEYHGPQKPESVWEEWAEMEDAP